VLYLQRGLILG